MNGAECNFVRLIYDSFLSHGALAGELSYNNGGQFFELRRISQSRYADQVPFGAADWLPGLRRAFSDLSKTGNARLDEDVISITGLDPLTLDDALRSPAAIPFREAGDDRGALDTHSATSGPYFIESAGPGRIELASNDYHPSDPEIRHVRILHMTDPPELRQRFARAQIDIMIVGGDEADLYAGSVPELSEGNIQTGPSTTVSMLCASPGGALADDDIRMRIASAIPRIEFCRKYLGPYGKPAYGFSRDVRADQSAIPSDSGNARSRPQVSFVVPPSERTVDRGRWLARQISEHAEVDLHVRVPSWPEYWTLLHSPVGGDLVWAGIHADADQTRYWVRYNLFGPWLPIPRHYAELRDSVWSPDCTERRMAEAERRLVADGWIMPLYHHYQCYLVRAGLQGFTIDTWDWPLPATQRITELSWR